MSLLINSQEDFAKKVKGPRANTQEVAQLLQVHDFTVGKLYRSAFVRTSNPGATKWYSLECLAKLVGEASGCSVSVGDLYEMISPDQALELLEELGKPRSRSSMNYWRKQGIGPRVIKVGSLVRYIRSEVAEWAKELSPSARGFAHRPENICPQAPHEHGANLEISV